MTILRTAARLAYTPEEIADMQARGEAYEVDRVLAALNRIKELTKEG
jgi:hypothetical protein